MKDFYFEKQTTHIITDKDLYNYADGLRFNVIDGGEPIRSPLDIQYRLDERMENTTLDEACHLELVWQFLNKNDKNDICQYIWECYIEICKNTKKSRRKVK